ncbi:MAG: glycoside hydrolase family 127 protein [Clostridia bacterium]|nr:glycoside hydrolase family 127 protein [Clostridia bacterium]
MTTKYNYFTSKEIKPRGWLRRQLELEASGLVGNLDKVWPDIRDSAWIGGPCEGWERVPYWLDGAVPLAYLLEDEDLIARVNRYVDFILKSQKEDGWICPCTDEERINYDTWAVLLISKVLVRYYECSGDERIPDAVYRIMKNYHEMLKSGKARLFEWGEFRWFEGFPALNFLAERHDDTWIRELAAYLRDNGTDYRALKDRWVRYLNKWTLETHIVNLNMMLKQEALSNDLLNKDYEGIGEELYDFLYKYNGTPAGILTGDECLGGISPIHGSELCSVVEMMDSMSQIYAYTGNAIWAERLEKVAFNALPATISDDMWSHQYVQMSNQIDCTPFPGKSPFTTNNQEAHIFGLQPHYGCCTSNMGQGWPKLALSAFLKCTDGVISAVAMPSEVSFNFEGADVKVTLDTDYPFKNSFTYRINSSCDTAMKLKVRIPSFAKNLSVNGKNIEKEDVLTFDGFMAGETVIELSFECDTVIEKAPSGMNCVRRGALLFSLPIKEEWKIVEYVRKDIERKYPYCDYEITGHSEWEFGFDSENTITDVSENGVGSIPFAVAEPPVTVKARLTPIDWGFEEGYDKLCAKYPSSTKAMGESREMTLVPYGCAKLRMTEMPLVKK